MKYWISILFVASLALVSCNGDDDVAPSAAQIEQYLTDNNITAQDTTSSGLIYLIDTPGGSEKPTLSDRVTVTYTGAVSDGTVFETTGDDPVTFPLNGVIQGWQEGIPLIGKGGKIKLICPPELAYGNNPPRGSEIIKAGSVLIFDVELVDF